MGDRQKKRNRFDLTGKYAHRIDHPAHAGAFKEQNLTRHAGLGEVDFGGQFGGKVVESRIGFGALTSSAGFARMKQGRALALGKSFFERNIAKDRESQSALHILLGLNGVVHVFEKECEARTHENAEHHGEQDVQKRARLRRKERGLRRLDNPDIVAVESAQEPDLLRLLEEDVVELLVVFRLPLKYAIVDNFY